MDSNKHEKRYKNEREKNEMVKDLVVKIEKRAEELKKMRETETKEMLKRQELDFEDEDGENMQDMGFYNFDKDGQGPGKGIRNLKDDLEQNEDAFLV